MISSTYSRFSSRGSEIALNCYTLLIRDQRICGIKSKKLRKVNVKTDCQKPRRRRKETGCQKKQWKLPRRELKSKPWKTKNSGKNLSKNIRQLLEETRSYLFSIYKDTKNGNWHGKQGVLQWYPKEMEVSFLSCHTKIC